MIADGLLSDIRVTRPCGVIETRGEWTVIGSLIVTGSAIDIVPRSGIDAGQASLLRSAADQVWLNGRAVLTGWRYSERLGWVVDIRVRRPAAAECWSRADDMALERLCAGREVLL